jgi:hypothetical protein
VRQIFILIPIGEGVRESREALSLVYILVLYFNIENGISTDMPIRQSSRAQRESRSGDLQ